MKKFQFNLFMMLLLSTSKVGAQDFPTDQKLTFNVNLSLPHATSNQPFKTIMKGLVNAEVSGQYTMPFGLAFGAGFRYLYFDINEFRTPYRVYGGMHSYAGFAKVGYEKFLTPRFAIDLHVKVGLSANQFFSDTLKRTGVKYIKDQSIWVEPTLGLVLAVDEFSSYRLNVGYAFQGFGFGLPKIGVYTNGGYNPADYSKITNYLLVGFGYTYYFHERKKS